MRKTIIVSDSTCDLSEELIKKYNITILPLFIIMDDKPYRDGIDITIDEIYKWSDEYKKTPGTSAISFEDSLNVIKKFDNEDTDIIAFTISSKMSSSFNVINLIADELQNATLYPVDSLNLSTGIGIQVLKAAILAQNGMSGKEIFKEISSCVQKVRASFVVDTLIYLQRGGRCNAVTALLASALKLKPEITVSDGVMGVSKKYRGDIKRVTLNYVKDLTPSLLKANPECVFITHSGSDPKIVKEVYDYLVSLNHFKNIEITIAGGVISSHCGPSTLGVLFYDE